MCEGLGASSTLDALKLPPLLCVHASLISRLLHEGRSFLHACLLFCTRTTKSRINNDGNGGNTAAAAPMCSLGTARSSTAKVRRWWEVMLGEAHGDEDDVNFQF